MHSGITRRKAFQALALMVPVLAPAAVRAESPRIEHLFSFGTRGSGTGQFGYVEDFAFPPHGRLLVTDAAHGWVQVFEATTGRFLDRFGGKGDTEQNPDKPEDSAVDRDDHVFVADCNTGFIQKYAPDFPWLQTFTGYGAQPGQAIKPEFMDIRDGRLYVPEAGNHRAGVFDLSGRYLFSFAAHDTAPGEMDNPEACKFGPQGVLYLTDLKNDRVQVFDCDGKPLLAWDGTGVAAGQFHSPVGLAIDAVGRVYVTEIGNNRVKVFDLDGSFLTKWGRRGISAGEFANLHGIAVHPQTGLIYVADTSNNRVQVFRPMMPGHTVL